MTKELKDLQIAHHDKIIEELDIVYYRLKRYHHKYTVALFYSDVGFDYDIVKQAIRMTDPLVKLENDLFLLIFEDTEISGGIRASEKLISALQRSTNQNIYSSIEECHANNEGNIILHKLFNLIDFSIKNNHYDKVIDKSYLDGIY